MLMTKTRSSYRRGACSVPLALLVALGCADDEAVPRVDGAGGADAIGGAAHQLGGAPGHAGDAAAHAGDASAVEAGGGGDDDARAGQGGQGSSSVPVGHGGVGGDGDVELEAGRGGVAGAPEGGSSGQGPDAGGAGAMAGAHAEAGAAGAGPGLPYASLPCDVQAALAARCTTCHGTLPVNDAPMSLVTWEDVNAYAQAIQEKIEQDLMPPPGAPGLTSGQMTTLVVYASLGAPPALPSTCPQP
jgi:hypothetical protein